MQTKTLVTVVAGATALVVGVVAYLIGTKANPLSANGSPITVSEGSGYVFNQTHLDVTAGVVTIDESNWKPVSIYFPNCASKPSDCTVPISSGWMANLSYKGQGVATLQESPAANDGPPAVVITPVATSFVQQSANVAYQPADFDTVTVQGQPPLSCSNSRSPCSFVIHYCTDAHKGCKD
jgi:hypothetical protein